MGTAERRVGTIKLTLDNVVQELKRLFLKIDDQSLADGTYRSGRDHPSTNLPPPPPPVHPPQQPPPYHHPPLRYPLQHPQFNKFFYEEKLCNPLYQYNEYENEGMVYERRQRLANPNQNRGGEFPNLIRKSDS